MRAVRIELEQDPLVCVDAQEGDTILASLLRAGVDFPHDCQAGNCGSCKCELVSGEITELPYSEFALDAEERARDLILACRSQVWSDCVVRPLSDDEIVMHPMRIMQCEVVEWTPFVHNVRALKLRIKSGGPYTFSAGQGAELEFAPGMSAYYPMANRPVDALLEFFVPRLAGDAASDYAHANLSRGDSIKVTGPSGQFYLRGNHQGPIIAVATGDAFGAVCSIVETALMQDAQRRVALYHMLADESPSALNERVLRLEQKCSNLTLRTLSSTPPLGEEFEPALALEDVDLGTAKAYIAGPAALIEAVSGRLRLAGMSERDIHAEALRHEKAAA